MLKQELADLFSKSLKKISKLEPVIQIDEPQQTEFGDYSINLALALSKELKKNPRALAQEIIEHLPKNTIIEKTDIAGPGFINVWIKDTALAEEFFAVAKKTKVEIFGNREIGRGKIAITDTSHPNVAKPMGVHHLLSTVIGAAINNLLLKAGYKVIRDNYLGDWGTQFGKLMVAIHAWGKMEEIQKNPIPELLKLYVRFHEEVARQAVRSGPAEGGVAEDSNAEISEQISGEESAVPIEEVEKHPELEDQGRAEFKKLEDGDPDNRKLWEWIREISIKEFEKLWSRLDVSYDMIHGESYYEDKMKTIIDKGFADGIIVKGEKGALIIPMDNPNLPPALVQKSDGATTYLTRDLARIRDWEETYHCSLGVNVVDVAQKLHFEQLFEAGKKLGILQKEHLLVDFGRMAFLEEAMSTRKGKVISLESVLDEAEKRALEKIELHKSELPEEEKKELARKMGIGAIKYNVLSQNRMKNYTFDWDQMLSFEGNSAPYLQYAYTRTRSVLKKSEGLAPLEKTEEGSRGLKKEEKELMKKIFAYEEVLEESLTTYKPSTLCTYLFELAQAFSHFYNNIPILNPERQCLREARLQLVEVTGYVLRDGLTILGIEVPERM